MPAGDIPKWFAHKVYEVTGRMFPDLDLNKMWDFVYDGDTCLEDAICRAADFITYGGMIPGVTGRNGNMRARKTRNAHRRVGLFDDVPLDQLEKFDDMLSQWWPDDVIGEVVEPNGTRHAVMKDNGFIVLEEDRFGKRLAYWDYPSDIFMWACENLGLDCHACQWIDASTGEVFDMYDIDEEYLDDEFFAARRGKRAGRAMRKRAYMHEDDILDAIYKLSLSQGFYGRLLDDWMRQREYDPDGYDELMGMLEEQKFEDALDMVLFFEC